MLEHVIVLGKHANYSVDQIIWFSTEYQIMIIGYEPNNNYLQIIFG